MSKSRMNKSLCISAALYFVMAGDILINSYIANKWFNGVSQVRPSFKVGPLVINPLSVSIVFMVATLFLMFGLWTRKRARS